MLNIVSFPQSSSS